MSTYMQKQMQLLKIAPFRWFIISSLFACFGNGLAYIGTSWLLVKQSGGVHTMTLLMISFWLPTVFFGPLGGVIADKYSRKTIVMATSLIRGLLLLGFGFFATQYFGVWSVCGLFIVLGLVFSVYWSAASAFIRELVPKELLMQANALLDITYEVANVVGMGSAGFILALGVGDQVLTINGICFIVAFVLLFWATPKYGSENEDGDSKQSYFKDLKLGLSYLFSDGRLVQIYTIQMVMFVIYMITPILLLPFAKTVLHADSVDFGEIEAALSAGVIAGGLVNPYFSYRFGIFKVVLIESVIMIVMFYWFANIHSIRGAEILYFIGGFSFATWPLLVTRAQELTDIKYQGRMQAIFSSLSGALTLLVFWMVDWLGRSFHVSSLYWIEIILSVIAVVMIMYYRKCFHK